MVVRKIPCQYCEGTGRHLHIWFDAIIGRDKRYVKLFIRNAQDKSSSPCPKHFTKEAISLYRLTGKVKYDGN